jgi:hypothetical protein
MKTFSPHEGSLLGIAAWLAVLAAVRVNGKEPQPLPSPMQKTSFDRAALRETPSTVHFSKRPARIGDEVEQAISLEMRLATSVRRGNELTEKSQTSLRAEQRRVVATTEVEAGRTVAVRLQYLEATKHLYASDAANAAAEPQSIAQPTAGKTYVCRREPGRDGKLLITDQQGNIPPVDEYEIVAQHMEMVGRPNPLAEFLAGKTMAVGHSVQLPQEIAAELFNLGDQFGEVLQFDLTLQKSQTRDGQTQAVFLARVEAASNNSSQMRLQVEGPLLVQVETCRAAHVDLSGPIGMSETRGSYSTAYQVIGAGQLKMSIASTYRDATR